MLFNPQWNGEKLVGWRRVLWEAADLIEREGWVRRKYHTPKGYCIMGAIEVIKIPMVHRLRAARHLDEALNGFTEVWNDKKGRTQPEVVAKLREIALG